MRGPYCYTAENMELFMFSGLFFGLMTGLVLGWWITAWVCARASRNNEKPPHA